MTTPRTREDALALDAADELAALRGEFLLPEGIIYLDGNSLGALPRAAPERLRDVVLRGWGEGLVRSWNACGWIDLPLEVGAAIAPLIGAAPEEVVVADSTSVNLFKLLAAALHLRPGRTVILSEQDGFPTDRYIAQGLADLVPGVALRLVDREGLAGALDEDVAVLALSHVDFRTGELLDMEGLTAAAHRAGALSLWDVAHSAGAAPVELGAAGADLAVGCGYKYLSGGPGAPSFAFVARRLQEDLLQPLWGWMGHAAPFALARDYRPAPGIGRLLCGTPPILSLAALAAGVETIARAGIPRLRRKSLALTALFVSLVAQACAPFGFALASPSDPARRGSQVSLRHPEGYAIVQALIARGVIPDFREPELLRFGFAPAYVRFADVFDAVVALRDVMIERAWDRPEHRRRGKVT